MTEPTTTTGNTALPSGVAPTVTAPLLIEQVTKSEAYNDAQHPGHAQAVAQARDLYQEAEGGVKSVESGEAVPEPAPADLRQAAGYERPDMPAPLAERWSEAGETEFVSWGVGAHIPGDVLNRIVARYVEEQTTGGRMVTGEREADAEQWREYLQSEGLSQQQADSLIAWHRKNAQGR